VAGVILGFAGVAVFLRAWDAVAAAKPGDLLSLGAAAAFGAYGVVNQPLTARYTSRTVMGYGLGIGGTLVTLVSLPAMIHQDWTAVGGTSWLILVFAAVGPVYVAYALWNWAIHHRGVARTVVYGFLVPVVAWVLALATLHERVRPEQVAGAMLVVAGLVVSRVGSVRQARRTRALMADPVGEP
jgi:drug/metabolite transporter (DMT)-like permease